MDNQVITFLITLAGVTIIPIATFATNLLIKNAKLTSIGIKKNKRELLDLNIYSATKSAQQKYKAGFIKDRKLEAMETIKRLNKRDGIDVPDDILDDLIESTVPDVSPIVTPPIIAPVTLPVVPPEDTTPKG